MKDNSDVQYELAVRIASRNIPVFTRVHSAVFASGAVTCILLVFLFFSTAIHIVSAFDFYRVQFARITGNYEERMMTVTLRPAIPISLRETPNAVKLRFLSVPTLKNTSNLVGE